MDVWRPVHSPLPPHGVQNDAASQGKFTRGPTHHWHDDSLVLELEWDSQNPARELFEQLKCNLPAELPTTKAKIEARLAA